MTRLLVAILGCGPSGLIAAHIAEMYGAGVVIFSRKQKSRLGGAQYSHIPIIGLNDPQEPEAILRYEVYGTEEEYCWKVYGPDGRVPFVSMSNVYHGKEVMAWNLRSLYDRLWEKFEDKIIDADLTPTKVTGFEESPFDLVFTSIPLPSICLKQSADGTVHWFRSQPVRIWNEAVNDALSDNTILYDGTSEHSYYRMSRIFGVGGTEWGASSPLPPLPGIITVNKPIETNCDCHPYLIRIGRFGTWRKGVLTFHSMDKVMESFQNAGVEI